ncbi:MAG: hypothetical protein WAU49_04080 [Steroidobacteraceae bacterium]
MIGASGMGVLEAFGRALRRKRAGDGRCAKLHLITGLALTSLLARPGISHSQVLSVSRGGTGASSFTQLGAGAITRSLDAKAKENALSLLDYCPDNTGATDCSTAIRNWLAEGIALHKALYIPAGTYRSATQQVWNLHSVATTGINVFGDGRAVSIIRFDAGVASPAWEIVGNDTPEESLVYSRFEDFEVLGNTAGTLMAFGRDDFNDALNEFQLNNLLIFNKSRSGAAVALKLNLFLNGLVNVDANGGGFDIRTNTGSGYAALYCNECIMNTFMGSYGISGNGIYLSRGYNVTNTFLNTDTEANTSDIRIDSANAVSNTWVGGQISLATYGINATAGGGNKFINVNNAIVGAGTRFMPNSTGVWLETPNFNNVSTPSMPASGSAYANSTGQVVMVAVSGGTVSLVRRNATRLFATTNVTVLLEPGDSITITYTAAPDWTWTPIR